MFLGHLFDDHGKGPSEKAVEALAWRLAETGSDAAGSGLGDARVTDALVADLSVRDGDADRLLSLLGGCETCYAEETITDDGRRAYIHMPEPLRARGLAEHLRGEKTLGFYLLRADSAVNALVVDVDVTKRSLPQCGSDEQRLSKLRNLALRDALRVSSGF